MILDEPTAALGTTQRMEVLNQIVQLRARGLGVIMISHNLDDIGAVADRVVVLRHGKNNGMFDVASATSGAGPPGDDRCAARPQRLRPGWHRPPPGPPVGMTVTTGPPAAAVAVRLRLGVRARAARWRTSTRAPDDARAVASLALRHAAAVQHHLAGRSETAVPLLEQILLGCRAILGDRHTDTLVVAGNLAVAYLAAGHTDDGFAALEEVCAERERVFGWDDPRTLTALDCLAAAHRMAGHAGEAMRLGEVVALARERVLGPTRRDDARLAAGPRAGLRAGAGRRTGPRGPRRDAGGRLRDLRARAPAHRRDPRGAGLLSCALGGRDGRTGRVRPGDRLRHRAVRRRPSRDRGPARRAPRARRANWLTVDGLCRPRGPRIALDSDHGGP